MGGERQTRWRRSIVATTVLAVSTAASAVGVVSIGSAGAATRAASTTPPAAVQLRAGLSSVADGRVAVLAFLPATLRVTVGEQVTWSFPSTEPHSVTFVPTGTPQPRYPTDSSLAAPPPATGPITPSTFVNSGFLPTPTSQGVPTFTVSFAQPGSYPYYCVLHPNMVGTVEVGAVANPQADVTARGYTDGLRYVAEGRAAERALLARRPERSVGPGGATVWTVAMGASTDHTEVYAYAPSPAKVRSGDVVTFVNDSAAPHTASFGGKLVPTDPEAATVKAPSPGPGPVALVSGAYLNTGWLPPGQVPDAPPLAARSFSYTAGSPGKYEYECVLHVASGMAGVVRVTP